MDVPISVVVAVVVALAGAIGVLYRQNLSQQKEFLVLLVETKELMGGLSELIRNNNILMDEVKDNMKECTAARNAEPGTRGTPDE